MKSTTGFGSRGPTAKWPSPSLMISVKFPPSSLYLFSATRVSRSSHGSRLPQTCRIDTPALAGVGAGAGEAYAWAIQNPDKVSCIYGENPALRSIMSGSQPPLNDAKNPLVDNLAPLAKTGVPILHVCGSLDPWLDRDTRAAEKKYKELGGQMTVIVKPGEGHFPVGPQDPAPVVDLIVGKAQ